MSLARPNFILFNLALGYLFGLTVPVWSLVIGLFSIINPRQWPYGYCLVCWFAVGVGIVYQSWWLDNIDRQLNRPSIEDEIFRVVDKTPHHGRLIYLISDHAGWRYRLPLSREPPLEIFQKIQLSGHRQPLTGNGDYIFAQKSRHLIGEIEPSGEITVLVDPIDPPWRWLASSRLNFSQAIDRLTTPASGALLEGILIGQTDRLSQVTIDQFRASGLSHLIAVSGYNLAVVCRLLERGLGRFGNRIAASGNILAIILFVWFAGGSPSIVRAAILAIWLITARLVSRKLSMARTIVISAALMAVTNPLIVRYDLSFQLSYAAVIGLMLFASPISDRLVGWPLPSWLRESLSATLAAQLTTWPLIAHNFESFNPYALIANIAVGPLVPLITVFGFPTVALITIWPTLAAVGLPFSITLNYILQIATIISAWPGAVVTVPPASGMLWFIYYGLLGWLGWRITLPHPLDRRE